MDTEVLKTIGEKIEGLRTCMFVTRDTDGNLKARPMSTQDTEFDGTLWFMTDKRSNKCREIEAEPTIGLEYAHSNGVRFVSISGTAELAYDKARIDEFWNPFYKAWFESSEDPNITLLKIKATRAEYWDNKGGKIGGLADIAIGAVTGESNTLDEHDVVTFS